MPLWQTFILQEILPCGNSPAGAPTPPRARLDGYAILECMQSPLQTPTDTTDPKSVKVNLTTGTGVDIDWKDGHASHYSFVYLRDACPCAMCEDERGKAGRRPGDAPRLAPGALPMFKPTAKPLAAEGVGRYAIKFSWNDNHDLGIYSWRFLREICPCAECKAANAAG
jgi:DUF971 family protein